MTMMMIKTMMVMTVMMMTMMLMVLVMLSPGKRKDRLLAAVSRQGAKYAFTDYRGDLKKKKT